MKKISFYLLTLTLLLNTNLFSQNDDGENMANNEMPKPQLLEDVKEEINYVDLFEISTENAKKAKTLGDAMMRTNPSSSSEKLDLIIPKGAIVETYKYFPKDAAWIVKYNDTWGFVSTTMIMPVQEKASTYNFTPYDEAPQMLSSLQINYPKEARRNKIQGKVYVKIFISKTGAVEEAEVIKSIPGLDMAAIEAIKKVKFKPGKYHGKPVDVWVRIPINFELGGF